MDQIGGQFGQAVVLSLCPSVFEPNIASFNIAKLAETLDKAVNIPRLRPLGTEYANNCRCWSLSASCQRDSCSHTAKKCDELAPSHVRPQAQGDGILPVKTSTLIGRKPVLGASAVGCGQCRSWVNRAVLTLGLPLPVYPCRLNRSTHRPGWFVSCPCADIWVAARWIDLSQDRIRNAGPACIRRAVVRPRQSGGEACIGIFSFRQMGRS